MICKNKIKTFKSGTQLCARKIKRCKRSTNNNKLRSEWRQHTPSREDDPPPPKKQKRHSPRAHYSDNDGTDDDNVAPVERRLSDGIVKSQSKSDQVHFLRKTLDSIMNQNMDDQILNDFFYTGQKNQQREVWGPRKTNHNFPSCRVRRLTPLESVPTSFFVSR